MTTQHDGVNLVSCGIDWITGTAQDLDDCRQLWEVALSAAQTEAEAGEDEAKWACHGYNGWKRGHVTWGSRHDGVIVRLGGPSADEHWREVGKVARHITRLDLQATVALPSIDTGLAEHAWGVIQSGVQRTGRPLGARLLRGTDGGQTVYIGSRSSSQMGRLYDKGVQEGTHRPGMLWRYEVELKTEAAESVHAQLKLHDEHGSWCASFTHGWYRSRGIEPVYASGSTYTCRVPREQPQDDRVMRWLATNVRPSISRMVDKHGSLRVLTALGLTVDLDASRRRALEGLTAGEERK